MDDKVYSRTFQKAAELCGGQKKLARLLRVPIADLEKWIAGRDTPPISVFLKAIDFVLDETPSPAAGSEPDEPSPRDCAGVGHSPMMC
ncbi:MAG: hypothetical protein ACREUE_11455 [Panacagrimonas sp.]